MFCTNFGAEIDDKADVCPKCGVPVQGANANTPTVSNNLVGAILSLFCCLPLGIPAVVHAPKGWLLRTAQGVDVSGEEAFKERFSNKDVASLRSRLSGRRAPAARTAAEQQKKIG